MVVFKKRCTPVTNATTQGERQIDETIPKDEPATDIPTHEAAQLTQVTQQHGVSKAVFGAMRYSDMVAKRKSTINVTPIKKLVDTFELFEQVLDYLPMKEVLLATRVCRAFKDNIENSSLLQAKLFLAPDLTMKKLAVSSSGTLLSGAKAENHIATAKAEGKDSGEIALYILHPALKVPHLSDRYRHMGIVCYAKNFVQALRFQLHNEYSTCFGLNVDAAPPAASNLHKMLLSQPPIKEVTFSYIEDTGRVPYLGKQRTKTIRNETGVTFGDVLGVVQGAKLPDHMSQGTMYVSTKGGFLSSARARSVVEMAGELGSDDDPTAWLHRGNPGRGYLRSSYRLKDDGFAFA
jgi:hypothetical protein